MSHSTKTEARAIAKQFMADMTDPRTGKILPAHELNKKLRNMERDKRREEQKQKAEAVSNPPPPLPTYQESMARLKAENEGRRQAAAEAADKAAAEAGPVNPFLKPLESFKGKKGPLANAQRERLSELATEWEQKRVAAAEAAAKQAAIDNDPAVVNVRKSADYLVKMAEQTGQPELVKQAQEAAGIAAAGSVTLYWQRMKEVESRILNFHDDQTAKRLAAKNQADAEFAASAKAAQESKARLDEAGKNDDPPAAAMVTAE